MEICPKCGSPLELIEEGRYKKFVWERWKCTDPYCDYETCDEPDYDSEPGGHDYY